MLAPTIDFDFFLAKCENFLSSIGFDFLLFLFQNKHQLQDMHKSYFQMFIKQGEIASMQQLKKSLLSKLPLTSNEALQNAQKKLITEVKQEEYQQIESIFVKKDLEREKDSNIIQQLKRVNKKLFARTHKCSSQNSNQHKLYQAAWRVLKGKLRECLPIVKLLQKKITSLKTLHIQYTMKINDRKDQLQKFQQIQYRYSISAFQFFKVVHENRLLTEVTLKGVQVKQFQYFLRVIKHQNKDKRIEEKREEQSWVKSFFPSKILKLSITALVYFGMYYPSDKIVSSIEDLVFFTKYFQYVSNIQVSIGFGIWRETHKNWKFLTNLCKNLRGIRMIKANISAFGSEFQRNQISAQLILLVRSLLFGEFLSSLTQVAQLSFKGVLFNREININDFLAIEESLRLFFEKNIVTSLKVYNCKLFPIFPQIKTLHSIDIQSSTFRNLFDFESEMVLRNNPNLRFIKYKSAKQQQLKEWEINNTFFSQLQTLILQDFIVLSNQPMSISSSIKHLILSYSTLGTIDCLALKLPQLFNLTCLKLSRINFGHQIICTIPSPHLDQLYLSYNDAITDQGVKKIDQKWPNLRHIQLKHCHKITAAIEHICKFEGLMSMLINNTNPYLKMEPLQLLTARGIQVIYYYFQ